MASGRQHRATERFSFLISKNKPGIKIDNDNNTQQSQTFQTDYRTALKIFRLAVAIVIMLRKKHLCDCNGVMLSPPVELPEAPENATRRWCVAGEGPY